MKTKEEIEKLLTIDERLRDSDSKLIARFWANELSANLKKNQTNGLVCI